MPKSRHDATATFKLHRMNDPGRSRRLKSAMSSLEGISKVDINYILDTVSIKYDAKSLTLEQIRKKVDRSADG
jgi:copper chaperone CopZ